MHLALFDLDRTLIDVNSGHLWLRRELHAGRISWWKAAWAVWWLARYQLGSGQGIEAAFAAAVAGYEGLDDAVVADWNQPFFLDELLPRLRPGAAAALRHHRANGDRIALASSTTHYLATEACRAWGLELAACTRLAVTEGRLTGKISASAIGPRKADRVREWAEAEQLDLRNATFYTDSATDVALLRLVGAPVCVNPDRRLTAIARQQGWEIVDWGAAG
jgi:HAD superfamily hydrolase (TIGR01490 family)